MDLRDDKELYEKLKQGDGPAFKVLFQKFYAPLCHYAYQLLHDNEMAEETVQELFVHVWEKRASLTIETSVKHYLFRSVRNQCLNQLEHQKVRKQYASKIMASSAQEIDPEQSYLEVDLMQRIEKSIASLPPKRQEIFRLSREQGLKYQEIADRLNLSVKTVEAQMGQALKHLRDHLKEFSNHLISFFFILKK